jgi:hypothetical protein
MIRFINSGSAFLQIALIAWIALSNLCQAGIASKPIVDLRFDAPYSQVVDSSGDKWAPTWGTGDVLYTASGDGPGLGTFSNSVAFGPIAFGMLRGRDVSTLHGVNIDSMRDYWTSGDVEPDGATWRATDTYSVNGTLYMFVMRCVHPGTAAADHRRMGSDSSEAMNLWDVPRNCLAIDRVRLPPRHLCAPRSTHNESIDIV